MSAVVLPLADAPASRASDEETYVGYAYSYPHKSAYGPLDPRISLSEVWQQERRDALFLYIHVPFCEMRCGFCNLFARGGGDETAVDAYLDALERQARVTADVTAGERRIVRMAVGGGTPTYLTPAQLSRLFDIAERCFDASPQQVATSVETSPKTAEAERVRILRERGVERVSLGVQSFIDAEAHAIGRPQASHEVRSALDRLRAFPVLNIDLIYGHPLQTVASWLFSLTTALSYQPEEIYLYPLYVRPGTGLGRRGVARSSATHLRQLYRAGRDALIAAGYEQVSMRYFRRADTATQNAGPVYCCQTDDMLGLGAGARSYTSRLHYSSRFAVESSGVHAILDEWVQQSEADFEHATWGVILDDDDRRRRFVLQSLLMSAGLADADLRRLFHVEAADVIPRLTDWIDDGIVARTAERTRLTPLGLELSDWIGPALYSPRNLALFERFTHP